MILSGRADDRGTGRTYRMIMALPETGAVVLVPHGVIRRDVERMIVEHRGLDFLRKCKVLVVARMRDIDALHGLWLPIREDHTWHEAKLEPDVRAEVAWLKEKLK